MRDFYELLEIEKTATKAEIKKAYRKKAKQCHPDLHPGDEEAERTFKEVNFAYEVLSDEQKRKTYDMYGEEGLRSDFGAQGGAGFGGFGDFFGDIFDMFGGGFSANFNSGNQAKAPRQGGDIQYNLRLTFKEAVFGAKKEITIRRIEECSHCHGTGAEEGSEVHKCENCGGSGQVREGRNSAFGRFVQVVPCPVCGGTGEIIEEPCKKCNGVGKEYFNRKIEVNIPAGVDSRSVITLRGEGHVGENGGQPGSIYVYLEIEEDEIFKRNGSDLFVEIPIRYSDAVLGGTIKVPTLEKIMDYEIPAGTSGGETFRVKGQGVPFLRREGKGDLYFKVEIIVPQKVSQEERELLESLRDLSGNQIKEQEKGFFAKLKDLFD
ncbi:molecular chaperone DnaJ [Peptoniphilus sp. KCTC 25270]|uniref:molecular chaperone DnaJ n=1 Tax=Peptoniphilus sp. KCTC 25270 TaxID=2897414 RepID=UPI001E4AF827|nr:molecular chaperone DnaJ [Peptoniphilus sp. KCTC 25270]MCD1146852.1 molecular chaperone DnaJ [Peptoniphilus sp. KCTC 25270]